MTKGSITYDQAIATVGKSAVSEVERKNCEPTGRVGFNGICQDDDLCEWSASIDCKNTSGDDVVLVAYYYTTNEQDRIMAENSGDGSYINWKISGFEIY